MRILHVNKFLYRRGGAEGYMLDVAARQRAAGHEVRHFGMDHPDNDVEQLLGPLPSYVEFEPAPSGKADRLRLLGRMVWSRETRQRFAEGLDGWTPDLVHCHNIYHQLSPSLLAETRRRGIPVVMTLHDYKLVCPTYQFLDHGKPCTACVEGGPWQASRRACKDGSRAASTAAAAEVWLHRRTGAYAPVSRFVAPSRFLGDQVAAGGVYPDRITVLDNMTDVAGIEVAGRPGRGLVFAGRLSWEKNVDTLVRAVGLLEEGVLRSAAGADADADPVLQIAGDGPERAALEDLAAQVAPGRVRFLGRLPKDRLSAVLREASASVVTSRWYENQPLAVLEAFAAGVPVVATRLGGLPEIVQDPGTGWLVGQDRHEDPAALASVLAQVLRDPVEAHARGRRAREVALRRFSPEVHLAGLDAVYAAASAQQREGAA